MDDATEEALEKIRKAAEGLSHESRDLLQRVIRSEAQEQANIDERLKIARAFAAAMEDEADPQREKPMGK